MATYKETVGTAVVNYAGNYPGAVDGELWYDSTNKDFKYKYPNVTAAGSWRTANNINTARSVGGSAGSTTSALYFGGSPSTTQTESYNGTNWTEVNDLNSVRGLMGGAGVDNTSALAMGGEDPGANTAKTESWNGSNWTEVNDLTTARRGGYGAGVQANAIYAGGRSTADVAVTGLK
jgi:hypothetical protein